tara:strand:- start:9 stop:2093 length:2085 start_codon:yes stop_codon:yes gene_type:complete
MAEEDINLKEALADDEGHTLASFVESAYGRSEDARYDQERRWLTSYRNYRGLYGSDNQFTESEKSQVFIKVTKTKVMAAYGQITDVLFAGQRFPIGISSTREPEGVAESVHFDPNQTEEPQSPYGFPGDGNELQPGDTTKSLGDRIGEAAKMSEGLDLKEGPGLVPTAITFHPADIGAKKMEKRILDQLEESSASKHLRSAAFEMALFGTGVLKGPFAVDKEYPMWEENEEGKVVYNPKMVTMPKLEFVSVWNFYPDPDAKNMEQAEFVVQRHKLSNSDLRGLKKRPFFNSEAIDECIDMGTNYVRKWWETQVEDEDSKSYSVDRFEVFEYWGNIDKELAEDAGLDIPDEYEDLDTVQINAWVGNGKILRLAINPFVPNRIPYFAAPYELNPYSFYGVGLAENMSDTQQLMNGFMRMAVDNAVLAGNLIFEIDETNLVPGQDLELYPGKIFRRQGGAPGQALFATSYPNVSNQNMQMFDKARVLSDEATGIPSFSHGQTGVTGTGRTAAGISMLMGAAQLSIKSVIKNIDDYLLQPLGEAFYAFNQQFDYDEEIKGDIEVKARGTESLMRNEVRSQRLIQLMQIGSSPTLAPFIKFPVILREIAHAFDLDAEKFVNDEREAVRQAEVMKAAGMMPQAPAQQAPQEQQPKAPEGGGVPAGNMTGTGNGNIGPATPAEPEMPEFSGQSPVFPEGVQ